MARKQYTPEEKAQLALEALRGERTINEIASSSNIHPSMLSKLKRDTESNLYTLFQDNTAKERREKKAHEEELQELYAQIGKLTTQNEWLKKIWSLSFRFRNAGYWLIWTLSVFQSRLRRSFSA